MPNTTYTPTSIGGIATGLTADNGSVQAGATLCDSGINVFSTVGTAGDSAILPANMAQYDRIIVRNQAAANSMDLFPNVGATINGGSANAAVAIAAGAVLELVQIGTDGLTWIAV